MSKNRRWKSLTLGCRFGLLTALACVVLGVATSSAAPMNGLESQYTQPDGTVITLKFFGDEFYARTETVDGYTVVFDPDTKTYYFAALSPDGKEFVSTGQEVGKADPAKLGIKKSLKINPESRAAKAKKRFEEQEVFVQQEARWKAVKEANSKYRDFKRHVKEQEKAGKKGFVIPMGTIFPDSEIPVTPSTTSPAASDGGVTVTPPIALAPPSFNLTGNVVGLTILIDFSDVPGTVVTQAQIDDYCNKPNYTGFSNAGSIYDYFSIQSAGNLRYNNTVTYYVRVPNPKTYYNKTSVDCGTCGRLLLNDALNVLIANGYNFSNLTTKVVNGKNYVRACNVLFAGADSGVWSYGLWPHRSSITAKLVASNTYIYDYQITEIGTTANLTIGTVCHENGHMLLGYPDLYSYDGNAANIGNFSLMASSGSTHPVNIDSYLKEASGWMNVIDLNSASQQRCTVQVDGNQVYRYLNPAKATEYFMFEVRDNTGYEGVYGGSTFSVNPSAGLVAYHVFETGSNPYSSIFTTNNPNCNYSKPYELLVVEANPNGTKTPWYDDPTPDGSDAFKSTGKSYISDITTPALKFWDGTGRNTASGCIITNISPDGASMTFVVGAGVPSETPSLVLSRSEIDSFCAFGGTAASQTFTLCNGQGGTLSYTISDDQSWLSCSPATGTATNEIDTIVVSFATSGLAAGIYSATITITDPAASPTTATIAVSLTVSAQPVMSVSSTNISANGLSGMTGPQVPFTINNTGGGAMNYSLSKTQSWLTLSVTNGTVVGEMDTIYVNFDATALGFGTYHDTITITSPNASNSPRVIPVTLRVLLLAGSDIAMTGNGLIIAPSDMTPTIAQGTDYGIVSGPVEHTFGILNQSVVSTLGLTNAPKVTVSSPSGYFTLSQDAAAGSLAPGQSTSFKITYNPQAGGIHTGTVSVASTDSAVTRYSFALSGISVGMPAVTNYGAGPAEQASATLTGRLTAGGVANLYLCWGAADGGTSSTGAWEHVVALGSNTQNMVFTNQVTGLLYGISYDCRVYATNASGKAWSNLRNFSAAPPQLRLSTPGLVSGTISGGASINTATPNPRNSDGNAVTNMGPWRAKSKNDWGSNTTYVYTGQMYFDGTAYFFVESIDDAVWLKIDGTVYMNNTTWNDTSSSGLISKPQGWYDFELRLFNGGGGSGYINLNPGFQYHNGGGTSTADVDNWYPEDPGNASLFRTAYVLPVSPNSISNTIADNVTATTADLHGILKADQAVYTVTVFWSTNNNANATAWLADTAAGSRVAGTYTNIANQLISVTATSMPPSSAYYFTLRASNELTNMWAASNGSFYKVSTPVVNSSTGAAAVTITSATLSGTLSAGGTANAWICWGDHDAGVSSTSAWDHVQFVGTVNQGTVFSTTVTGLVTNKTYFYRCAVTNAAGADWSDTATSFSGVPSVGNGGSGYKMKISFANYNKTEPLTNFPALVVFSNGMAGTMFDFSTFLSTSGHDLRFTDSTGTTNLNYEIDTWSTAGSSYVWVQVPKFTNNCSIWARWGDASQASQPTYTTNGATWGNGYVGVWHMSQTNAQESTIKKYNGVASGNTNCSGFVGGAQAFGTGNQLTIPTLPFTSNAVSVEAWVQHRTVPSTTQNYFRFNSETAVLRHDGATSAGQLHFYVKNGSGLQHVRVSGQIDVGPWYYVAGTFNGSQLAYKNGVQVGSASPGGTLVTTATSAFMGMSAEPMDGYIDEVRLSSVARSANWLWASYMSMASNSVFNTIGPSQSLAPIANRAPTVFTNASALLNAALVSPETNYTVTVYWGPTDGGTNAGAWTNSAIVGSWTKVALTNISHAVSGLVPGGVYYYTFCATNSKTTAWAFPSWQFAPAGTNGTIKTTPTVSAWPTATSITAGQPLSASTLSGGSASVPGSFSFNAPSTVPPAGVYTAAVTFVASDSANYVNVSGTVLVTVAAVPTYTVSYNANSATSGTPPASQTKTNDVNLTLATNSGNLARTGYAFAGWNTTTNGTGANYAVGATYTANASATLYAKWSSLLSPTNLSATALSSTQIKLAWTDNSADETGFRVERSATSGSGFASIGTALVNATNYTDSTVGPGSNYYYRVSATNALANGTPSAEASATTPKLPATVTLSNLSQTYDGTARAVTSATLPTGLAVTITYNGAALAPTNAGSYAVTSTVVNATYTGSTNATLTVVAKNVSTLTVTNAGPFTYDGTAKTPDPVVKDGVTVLVKNTHYTLSYTANTNAGNATVIVTGAGNYTGTKNASFTINPAMLTVTPTAGQSKTYGAADPTLTYANSGAVASETAGFSGALSRVAGESIGTYAITQGTLVLAANAAFKVANYTLSFTPGVTFAITAKSASLLTIAAIAPFTYDGSAKTPEPEVKDGVTVLVKNTHYTLSYANNTAAGTATLTVTGMGNYTGTQNKAFTINKATPTVNPWPTGTVITVGQPLSASTLSGGSASVSGTFSFNVPSTVPPVGVCTAAVTFAAIDNVNYAAVNGTGTVTVKEAVPHTPTTLTALPSVGQVALSWTPSAGATSYNVKRASTLEGTYSTIASPAGTNFVDSGLSSGTTYYYRISARNDGGESTDSGAGSALIPYGLPFVENFEGLSLGSLDGQNGWSAVDTIVQTATARGTRAASITSAAGSLQHAFEGANTNVWTDFMLQPVFFEGAPTLPDPMGTVNFYFNNNGHPVVYDGTTPVELSAVTVTTGAWVRVTVRSDYAARKWNLYVNASKVASNLDFYASEPLVYTSFEVSGAGSISVALDDLSISLLPPWSLANKGTVLLFMLQ